MKLSGNKGGRWRQQLPDSKREWALFLAGVGLILTIVGIMSFMHARQVPIKYQADGVTIKWLPKTVTQWEKPINEMGQRYNIDPNLIAIVMTLESGGYSEAKSEVGAQGLMQVTPPTARDIANKYLKETTTVYELLDPNTNIEFGTAYLAVLRDEFGSPDHGPTWNTSVELVAAGYNGGPGAANALEQGQGLRSTQTVVYSRDVFNMWRERHQDKSPTYERWLERGGTILIEAAKNE